MAEENLLESKRNLLNKMLDYEKQILRGNLIENTVETPKDLKDSLELFGRAGEEWLREIKESKFQFLFMKWRDPSSAKEKFFKLKENEYNLWEKYVAFWDKLSEFEEIAYISFLSQLGYEYNTVHSNWYKDLNKSDSFKEWAILCRKNLDKLQENFKLAKFNKKFQELRNQIVAKDSSIYERELYSWIQTAIVEALSYKIELIHQYLTRNQLKFNKLAKKLKVSENEVLSWLSDSFKFYSTKRSFTDMNKHLGYFINGNTAKLLSNLAEKVSEEQLGKEEAILEFMKLIRDSDEFRCDICDFMEVTTTNGKSQIDLLTSTVKGPRVTDREQMRKLKENQSYKEGVGITGSIFLAPKNKEFFHVGSNCLERDFRQSEKQKSYYENKYYKGYLKIGKGKLRNFWEFPIYTDRSELQYTLRVVNKADPSDPNKLYNQAWDIPTRLQLCLLIKRFGDILKYISSGLIEIVRKSINLDWIGERKLRDLLNHLQIVPFRMIENRNLGCTIMVVGKVSETKAKEMPHRDMHLEISNPELENMFDYYDALDPDKCCLIFDENLKILSAKTFENKAYMIGALNEFTERNPASAVFRVDKGYSTIQIYQEGNACAEIYFSEAWGQWAFRNYSEIQKDILSNADYTTTTTKDIVKKVLELAYSLSARGFGALIIVGENFNRIKYDLSRITLKTKELKDINTDMESLISLAKLDGAMLITNDGVIQGVHAKINNDKKMIRLIEREKKKEKDNPSERISLYDVAGSRHKTGILISMECPKSLVFIVSQNKIITVLSSMDTPDRESRYFRQF